MARWWHYANKVGGAVWRFRVCGNVATIQSHKLTSGKAKACGCLMTRSGKDHSMYRHGMSHTPEHNAWTFMIARCTNPTNHRYKWYGARGIKVCDRWMQFEAFLEDMGERPSSRHSLDRIDNNGNYEPENCRWATVKQQARNRRTSRIVTFRGRKITLAELAEVSGLPESTLSNRFKTKGEHAVLADMEAETGLSELWIDLGGEG